MNNVQSPAMAGQQPAHDLDPTLDAHAWGAETRALLAALRALAFDGVAPRGERKHSRHYLRRTLKARLRALETRIDAIDPPTSGEADRAT